MGIGIYVHIPFCISKCAYCDFYSLPKATDKLKELYTEALIRHIRYAKAHYGRQAVDTVFIGGGTPTVLASEQLIRITDALNNSFNLTQNCEFTVEANPATFDTEKLDALKNAGVNRISLGIQSANDNELNLLGRIHSFTEAKSAFELTRNRGFDNISVDLMYGIPSQTKETFLNTIKAVTELSPDHISIYGLQLEENTPLCKNKQSYTFPGEDESGEMFSEAIAFLKQNGYNRYETSNFAKRGFECRHNLGYWSQKEYLGFGTGAYSFFGGKRYHIKSDINAFCTCDDFSSVTVLDEEPRGEEAVVEFIMLSLRLTVGFSEKELENRTPNHEKYIKRCEVFIKDGFMQRTNGRIFFTDKGFDVSNYILSQILFD